MLCNGYRHAPALPLHRTGGPEHCPDNAREGMPPKAYI